MVKSSSDGDDVSESESFRSEPVDLSSFDDSSTELVLLTVSPDVDGSIGGESDDVVGSADDLGEAKVGDGRERDGRELGFGSSGDSVETEETFGGLEVVMGEEREKNSQCQLRFVRDEAQTETKAGGWREGRRKLSSP